MDGLHREMRRQPVKHCHSAAVSDWRLCRGNAIPSQPAGVDDVIEFCFLEDDQVHVGLGHPPQRRLQCPITTVTDIIGEEPNRHRTPRRPPSTPTHPRPTVSFFNPAPANLLFAPAPPSVFSVPVPPPQDFRCCSCLRSCLRSPHVI